MIDQFVGDVMTRSVQTIPPETTACEVATLFADHDIGSAVVLDSGTGEHSGIVTESDIMQLVAAGADIDSVWFQIYVVVDDQLGGCQMKPLFWPARNPGDIAKEINVGDNRIDLETGYELGGMHDPEEMPDILTPDCRE
jgi:CBS domain-containing protein